VRARQQSQALDQVNWLISRFSSADDAGWTAPSEGELREHLADRFLSLVTPERLVRTLAGRAAELREEPTITHAEPLRVRARVGGMQLEATAEPEAPHRLGGLRVYPVGGRVNDGRVAAPSTRTRGEPPAGVTRVAEEAFAELGLLGLALSAGSQAAGPDSAWVTATGWAELDSPRAGQSAAEPPELGSRRTRSPS